MLIKYCKPEHNILDRCHTIQFGTFQYYREMDPTFSIGDPTEGVDETYIEFAHTSQLPEGASHAVQPVLGAFTTLPNELSISDVTAKKICPNCYIFCCTKAPEVLDDDVLSDYKPPKFGYTSSYGITDPERFAKALNEILSARVDLCNFRETARLVQAGSGDRLQVLCYFNEVTYVERKRSRLEWRELHPYAEDIHPAIRPYFVKEERFRPQQEFRFVFIIQHEQIGILSVRKAPVVAPILPISSLFEETPSADT